MRGSTRIQPTPESARSMRPTAYYASRSQLGATLAPKLSRLKDDQNSDIAILALSEGGAVMAIEFARYLSAPIGLLLTADINLPDQDTRLGVINSSGHFTRDVAISKPHMEAFEMEYRNAIARAKSKALSELHRTGHKDRVKPDFFRNKIVILVHDVTQSGTIFQAGLDFLHSVHTDGAILISGVASYDAQYYMQEHGDAHIIERLTDKKLPASHYFQDDKAVAENQLVGVLKESVIVRF